ncbi:hypothetical protein ACFYUV_38025 [Nonomuraea sp. NPDC003560]|uniref:hypothetical protein n=1 Tax=Nonomuraea sp. NPDC003560 TaxID=3364341 RepID=UPI0036B0F8A5
MKIGSYSKAIVAAASAGTGALLTAMGDNVVTPGEWVVVGLAVLAALGITAAVPNAERSDPRPAAASTITVGGVTQGRRDDPPNTPDWPTHMR